MHTFCFTDIHGNKVLFDEIYSYLNKLPYSWRCVFLGDACDRGKDGYEIMKALLANNHFIYLMGNHENMFVKAARALFRNCWNEGIGWPPRKRENDVINLFSQDPDILLSIQNGGFSTLSAWLKDGGNMGFVNKIAGLRLKYSRKAFDFCHSGTTKEKWLYSKDIKDFTWNEKHYNEPWFDGHILIFGHRAINGWVNTDTETILGNKERDICSFEKTSGKIGLKTDIPNTVSLLALNDLSIHIFKEP